MRGLSTLESSRSKQKGSGLKTLSGNYGHLSKAQSSSYAVFQQPYLASDYLSCAYHVGERITNFCKNQNCLLPLCPKCIKIHSQQHQRMGIYGEFQTIQQSLEQSLQSQTSTVSRLQQMTFIAQQMSTLHKQQMQISQCQLMKAKSQLIEYIDTIFSFYEQQVNKAILGSAKQYENQIVQFHKEVVTLMVGEQQLFKKMENQQLRLEALIDFYSKRDLNVLLNNYTDKIQEIRPKYLELNVNTYELERIKVILKKYLDFGEYTNLIEQGLQKNLAYQRATLTSNSQHLRNQSNFNSMDTNKQFIRSPIRNLFTNISGFQQRSSYQSSDKYGFSEKGQISKMILQRLSRQSKLQTFQSPLQAYSLQRSRKYRS